MRILVWDEGFNRGGIDRVTCSLLPEVAKSCESVDWLAPSYRHPDFAPAANSAESLHLHDLHQCWSSRSDQVLNACLRRIRKAAKNFTPQMHREATRFESSQRLRSAAKRLNSTHLYLPALLNHPFPRTKLPCIATLHDLNFRQEWKEECMRSVGEWAKGADKIICISQTVRDDFDQAFPSCTASVQTILNGYSPPLPSPKRKQRKAGDAFKIYYPASYFTHKRHDILLDAVQSLNAQGVPTHLALSGVNTDQINTAHSFTEQSLDRAQSIATQINRKFPDAVVGHGYVTTDEVEQLYAEADLVALPTEYEGYGLPLIEAVARGVPVICSDIPAFREQAALHGIEAHVRFVDAQGDWRGEIERFAVQNDWANNRSNSSPDASKFWTWEKAAGRYLSVFSEDCRA